MIRVIAIIVGLLAAIHVTVINIPAPVPAFLAAAGVIAGLCFAIAGSVRRAAPRRRDRA